MTQAQREHLERSWERISANIGCTKYDKTLFFIGAETALTMVAQNPELSDDDENDGDEEDDGIDTIYTEDTYSHQVRYYGRI